MEKDKKIVSGLGFGGNILNELYNVNLPVGQEYSEVVRYLDHASGTFLSNRIMFYFLMVHTRISHGKIMISLSGVWTAAHGASLNINNESST